MLTIMYACPVEHNLCDECWNLWNSYNLLPTGWSDLNLLDSYLWGNLKHMVWQLNDMLELYQTAEDGPVHL